MRYSIQIIFSVFLLIFFSCQNGSTESKGISDAELIQAIIDADKISIGLDDLPSNSKTVIEYDYAEYESESAKKAYGLGYEVNMAGKGHKVGSRCEVYFNLEGKRLDPYGRNGDKDKSDWGRDYDKGDWKCFDLSLPVSYTMPDGSTITVSNEEDWDAIKSWYEENPESEEKPVLQFPVNVEFDDETVTVNSEEELRELKQECWTNESEERQCFELVFPVTFIMPDASTITVDTDDDAGWQPVKDWYEANPDSDERPTLQFPVDIIYETEDGDSTLSINNDEEMRIAKENCRDDASKIGDNQDPEAVLEGECGRLRFNHLAKIVQPTVAVHDIGHAGLAEDLRNAAQQATACFTLLGQGRNLIAVKFDPPVDENDPNVHPDRTGEMAAEIHRAAASIKLFRGQSL